MANKRTIITISEEDKQWLESYSRTHGISVAEAIRRGIGSLKSREGEDTYKTLVKATKGI